MGKTSSARLWAAFLAIIVIMGGASVLKGGFYLGKHEGDTLHLLQMIFRMVDGELPHLDFVTPIGFLAMAPIAWLASLGMGAGQAILWSQVLVALVALPATVWVARSRFSGAASYAFGAVVMILILALVHGETIRAVSISMHYNRWAWAAAFLAVATAVLPARVDNRTLDGLVIGVAMAVMILTKATYFVAFLPAILVALIQYKAWRAILVGVVSGLAVLIVVTLVVGTPVFWLAYLRDLFTVAGSAVRPQPGYSMSVVVGAPANMASSLALLLSVIWLRQSGRKIEGLVMLLLVPAFFYVTFQNFGNDHQWLPLLGLMLFMLLPGAEAKNGLGWELRPAMLITAVAALCFGAPSVINLAYSPFRHMTADPEEHISIIPGHAGAEDILVPTIRAHRMDFKVALDGPETRYATFWEEEFREGELTEWQGEMLDICMSEVGTVGWFEIIAEDLRATGLIEGKTAFVADILNSFWLYGAFEPLKGNAPWYYGGLSGLDQADFVLVPLCPLSINVRHTILGELTEAETELVEVARDPQFILYEVVH